MMKTTYRLLLTVLAVCLPSLGLFAQGYPRCRDAKEAGGCCQDFRVTVFDNTHSAVPYRIPALAETRTGRLLAVCDHRFNHSDIGWETAYGRRIDILMRTSDDHGRTWSDTVCIARGDGDDAPVRVAYGDPGIVADRTSDEVLLSTVSGRVSYGQSTRQNPQHAILFHSPDGGKTWDRGTDLTEMLYGLYDHRLPNGGCPDGIFLTSGKIMQSRTIKRGKYYRLYIAHPVRQRDVGRCGTFVIFSDDFGRSWQVLGTPSVAPSIAQDESKLEELPDGSVLLSCRDAGGGRRFNVFTYGDSARATGSWGQEVMPANMTGRQVNACNGGLLIVPARRTSDGRRLHVALQSVPMSAKRDSVGFFYKEIASPADYASATALGGGWAPGLRVYDGSSCYSTMLLMGNRRVGFFYEKDLYNDGFDLEFCSLSLRDITKGAYEVAAGD